MKRGLVYALPIFVGLTTIPTNYSYASWEEIVAREIINRTVEGFKEHYERRKHFNSLRNESQRQNSHKPPQYKYNQFWKNQSIRKQNTLKRIRGR